MAYQHTHPRVCLLIESYFPVIGGMESQARTLSAGLRYLDIRHQIVTRRTNKDIPASEWVDGISITRIDSTGRWALALRAIPWLLRNRNDYDLVLVPGFRTLGMSAVIAGKLTGKPCILKADSRGELSGEFFRAGLLKRGISPSGLGMRLMMALWRKLLGRADAFISMSDEMTSEFKSCGIPPTRIHQIPNAIDVEVFKPVSIEQKINLRTRLGIPHTAVVFIYTGRLVSYKGLPVMLEAWRRYIAGGHNGLMLLVGSGGCDMHNCESFLKRFVIDHSLEQSIIFCGESPSVHEYLQVSDVFVFPTEEEAFGLSLIEAMSCGLPAISTMVGGIADFFADGENGIAIAPGAVDELATALRTLGTNCTLRKKLGKAAAQRVHKTYSADYVSQRYAELFSTILHTQ